MDHDFRNGSWSGRAEEEPRVIRLFQDQLPEGWEVISSGYKKSSREEMQQLYKMAKGLVNRGDYTERQLHFLVKGRETVFIVGMVKEVKQRPGSGRFGNVEKLVRSSTGRMLDPDSFMGRAVSLGLEAEVRALFESCPGRLPWEALAEWAKQYEGMAGLHVPHRLDRMRCDLGLDAMQSQWPQRRKPSQAGKKVWAYEALAKRIEQYGYVEEFRKLCAGGKGTRLRLTAWFQSKPELREFQCPESPAKLQVRLKAERAVHWRAEVKERRMEAVRAAREKMK